MVNDTVTNREMAQIELVIALETLIRAFKALMPRAVPEKTQERLIAASACDDTLEGVRRTVKNVASIMREIAWEATGDMTDLNGIIRRVEELGSIAHIARSYPDKAIARAKACGRAYLSASMSPRRPAPAWHRY